MKFVVGASPMVEMKMLRWNSLILIFVVGVGCCANAFGQREVSNFPSQLKDAVVNGNAQTGISKRTWLKTDIDSPVAPTTRVATAPKPDQATVLRTGTNSNFSDAVDPNAVSPQTRKEIEDKIRAELEEKFQSQIEEMVQKQVQKTQGSKTVRFGGPTMTGEILPLVPAKGYLLTDYTLRQKAAAQTRPTTPSTGASANFNDSNRRPVTRTLGDQPRVEGRVASIPLAQAKPAETTPATPPASTTPETVQAQSASVTQKQTEQDQASLLPPSPSVELRSNENTFAAKSLRFTAATTPPPITELQGEASNTPPAAAETLAVPPQEQVSILQRPEQNVLRSAVVGPEHLGVGQTETFEIIVENQSATEAKEVVVQLSVPAAITISRLDREAYLDRENRTISWQVSQIPGQSKEVIRYQATSRTLGRYPQTVKLGMNNTLQGVTPFTTVVTRSPGSSIQLPGNLPAAEVAERPTVEK